MPQARKDVPVSNTVNIEWVKLELQTKNRDGSSEYTDITPFLIGLSVQEGIFNKLLQGTLIFSDTKKIFSLFGSLIGDETVTAIARSKISGLLFELEFSVISMKKHELAADKGQKIELDLIDKNYIKFLTNSSTSFKKKKITDFLTDYSENVLGKELDFVEKSDKKLSFSFPYQNFKTIFKYLNQYLKSRNGYIFYVYYSTLIETRLETISNMMNEKHIEELYQVPPAQFELSVSNFVSWNYVALPSVFTMYDTNSTKNTSQFWDSENKSVVEEEHSYDKMLDREINLGKYSIFDSSIGKDYNYVYRATSDNVKNDFIILANMFDNSIKLQIDVKGLIERSCGKIVKLNFSNPTDFNVDENSNMTGYYLIYQIGHHFTKSSYSQSLKLIRNAEMIQSESGQKKITNKSKALR